MALTPPAAVSAGREAVCLRLFVAGNTPNSLVAIERARDFCRQQLSDDDILEIIDVAARPDLAAAEQIVALPALVRIKPVPRRVWVGDLSDMHRLRLALGLMPDVSILPEINATRNVPAASAVPRAAPTMWDEAHETLRAIAAGEVDAWLTRGPEGLRMVAREGADVAYRQLVETAEYGTATLSGDGTILYGNRCLAHWLEVEPERLAGCSLWSHLVEPATSSVRSLIEAAHDGRAADDVLIRSAKGNVRLLRLSFSSLADSDNDRLGLVATDVEELHQAVTELDWYREHLEDLVLERTARLQEALHAAEAAGRAKARFLANMSHEIRTPLNGILGMVYLMRDEVLPPVQAERLRKIELAGQHLLGLLTDILELTRIDAQRVTLASEPVDPAALLQRAADLTSEAARAKDLTLTVDPVPALPDGLVGDPRRLMQALLNLVSNAVKFTEHGRVTLRLVPLVQAADGVVLRFQVDDTGAGITPELRARLFQPFEQGEPMPTRRPSNGAGLGLAITRQLARLMGGDCGVEPRLGGGSRFWFSVRLARSGVDVPRTPAPAPVPRGQQADARPVVAQGGNRVLLVEDDAVSAEVAKGMLARARITVDCVVDGAEAVARVSAGERYAAILMDVVLPGVDGLEATRRIRQLPGGRDVPIVALTATAFAEDRARCLEAGMDDFLAKPIAPAALYAALAHWLPAIEAIAAAASADHQTPPAPL